MTTYFSPADEELRAMLEDIDPWILGSSLVEALLADDDDLVYGVEDLINEAPDPSLVARALALRIKSQTIDVAARQGVEPRQLLAARLMALDGPEAQDARRRVLRAAATGGCDYCLRQEAVAGRLIVCDGCTEALCSQCWAKGSDNTCARCLTGWSELEAEAP